MDNKKLRKLVTASLMAAMACVATFAIRFPTPTGYIHPGDAFVILSGIILGPLYGPLAAGIGSTLADLLAGYPQYAIATLLIKALAAFIAAIIYRKGRLGYVLLGGILGGIIIITGYFLYDGFLYGFGASIKGIPLNIIQISMGILISTLLYPVICKVPQIKEMMEHRK